MQIDEQIFSESDGGRPILVDTDASPGTLIHVGPTDLDSYDKLQIYAVNRDPANEHVLYVQWGGLDLSDLLRVNVPATVGLILDIPLLMIVGRAVPLEIRAYADAANFIKLVGTVYRASSIGRPGFLDRTTA